MFLIGQYDSPFVRRVGIALRLYELSFEHRPWSSFGDSDRIAEFNPLRRVPTLVLDSGEALIESGAILDWLDEQVEEERRLVADHGPDRRRTLRLAALSTGLADKAVILFYEGVLHKEKSDVWVARCKAQITDVLDVLEKERAAVATPYLFGDRLTHADIALAVALRFVRDVHPHLYGHHPALEAHSARCEALPVFVEISQPFVPPA
ncbi:MAG: glutathione S-transferase family protein [Bosea sp.]|nr:glutathione S-transferase family protein [Bosea sp. (in: a-proteobacteria)]